MFACFHCDSPGDLHTFCTWGFCSGNSPPLLRLCFWEGVQGVLLQTLWVRLLSHSNKQQVQLCSSGYRKIIRCHLPERKSVPNLCLKWTFMSVVQRLLSSLAWIQSHGVGTSQCVIIRSAIQTAHQLTQLIFREVTSALCLCLLKDKRKEAPGLLMFPRFHLTGEEQGRSVAHQPWIASNKARPFWQCGSSSASEQERPLWPLRMSVRCYLGKSSHCRKTFHLKKSCVCHHLPNFQQENVATLYKWMTFSPATVFSSILTFSF